MQLLNRHWLITDAEGRSEDVKGPGVVGQQPVIEPGQSHQYVSGCNLKSGLGKMYGTYLMEKVMDGKRFRVIIPEFKMIVPHFLN